MTPALRRWAQRLALALALAASAGACAARAAAPAEPAPSAAPTDAIDALIAARPGHTGAHVLDTGSQALLARAWLVENARKTIDVQYFIWSTDNVGILAAEALLRAAERGIRVRVIVDDLMIDAPDASLVALARHPQIEIRIYNPQTSVGVPMQKRLLNLFTDFRGVNQRMHDKTLIVDGRGAVTGGRNMAAEYFDYNHTYNFRDRDVLLLGAAVGEMQASFERFWTSPLAVPVEQLYDGWGLMQKNLQLDDAGTQQVYRELHAYARQPDNFAPEVRAAIAGATAQHAALAAQMRWGRVDFISDVPGKNDDRFKLDGGGRTTQALARLVQGAKQRVVIQSPYLVMSEGAIALFAELRQRGVTVRISTNSLASTDNLPAFSGYQGLRQRLLALGLQIHEYRPDAQVQQVLMQATPARPRAAPTFALHAKSMVIDGRTTVIGTFNFDPRSENLNTEVCAVLHDESIAREVETAIETDMAPANSWDAAQDDPDQHSALGKRGAVRVLRLMPIKPLL